MRCDDADSRDILTYNKLSCLKVYSLLLNSTKRSAALIENSINFIRGLSQQLISFTPERNDRDWYWLYVKLSGVNNCSILLPIKNK